MPATLSVISENTIIERRKDGVMFDDSRNKRYEEEGNGSRHHMSDTAGRCS